jgi:hypothetical protein
MVGALIVLIGFSATQITMIEMAALGSTRSSNRPN